MATKTTLDPRSLLGNAARKAPEQGKSSLIALALDDAQAAGFPASIPYPWPESPELTDPAKVLANEQAELDFDVITYLVGLESNPAAVLTTSNMQGIANKTGVIFSYTLKGEKAPVIYTPGAYFPGE